MCEAWFDNARVWRTELSHSANMTGSRLKIASVRCWNKNPREKGNHIGGQTCYLVGKKKAPGWLRAIDSISLNLSRSTHSKDSSFNVDGVVWRFGVKCAFWVKLVAFTVLLK